MYIHIIDSWKPNYPIFQQATPPPVEASGDKTLGTSLQATTLDKNSDLKLQQMQCPKCK